jgi:hypothetical protein
MGSGYTTWDFVLTLMAIAALGGVAVARRIRARLGLPPSRRQLAGDVKSVAFLRSMHLDPNAVLGREFVAQADAHRSTLSGDGTPHEPSA